VPELRRKLNADTAWCLIYSLFRYYTNYISEHVTKSAKIADKSVFHMRSSDVPWCFILC